MRIIERHEWEKECECAHCKTKYAFNRDDVKVGKFGGSYCETGVPRPYVKCPVCESDYVFNWSLLPPGIREYVERPRSGDDALR